MAAPTGLLSLRSDGSFARRVSFFESVKLLNVVGDIYIFPGSGRRVYWCFNGSDTPPATTDAMFGAPIAGIAAGGSHGTTVTSFELGRDHSFGLECKGVAVGNPEPRLHLAYVGGTAAATTIDVRVRAIVTIEFSGPGLLHA